MGATLTSDEAIGIIESYYPQTKAEDYKNDKGRHHEMILRLSGSFVVEGSNFKTLAFNPGAKFCLVQITDEKLLELKKEME